MTPLDSMTIAGWEATRTADATVESHGSILLLRPNTRAAREWIAANCPDDAVWWGGGIAVEHRYIQNIVLGMRADGLAVA